MSKEQMISVIEQQGVLPLFYHDDIEVCVSVMDALYKGGVKTVEFTNRGAYAFPILQSCHRLLTSAGKACSLVLERY